MAYGTGSVSYTHLVNILTFDDEVGRETVRHSASHLMAQAVKHVFKDRHVKLGIGPAIEICIRDRGKKNSGHSLLPSPDTTKCVHKSGTMISAKNLRYYTCLLYTSRCV